MKYKVQFHDGDKWCTVYEQEFDNPTEAKRAGVGWGFEHVRVVESTKELRP